jgi:transposase
METKKTNESSANYLNWAACLVQLKRYHPDESLTLSKLLLIGSMVSDGTETVKVLFHQPHDIMHFIDKYNELYINMTSRRYKTVSNRQQISLLPPSIEDYVHETNPVRAIDAYVNTLDLAKQGFLNTSGGICAGQPAYPPEALLKLYLYGYLNKVRSSRRLENETYRNLEVIWLVEELRPSYKTIADFRKNNSVALTATNRDFVLLCKDWQLFGGETLGIDGSFFKADASKDSIYTEDKLHQQLQQLEQKITAYQEQLALQDEA